MAGKRKIQRKHFKAVFALGRLKTVQKKGRDKAMVQKKTEYWQEVNSE